MPSQNRQNIPETETASQASELVEGTPKPEIKGAEVNTENVPASVEQVMAGVSNPDVREQLIASAGIGYRIVTFTIFLIAFLALAAYGLVRIHHVLELFIIGLLIAMAINPTVDFLERHGVRRLISVGALLVLLASGLGIGVASLGPSLVDQSTRFVQEAPQFGERLQRYVNSLQKRFPHLHVTDVSERLQAEATKSLSGIQGTATTIFTASVTTVAETLLVVFIVVFFLAEPAPLIRGMRGLMPDSWQSEVERIGELAIGKVEAWIQGSLILMLTIAVADTVGLAFLGVPYALLWGVLSGLLEIIPTLGPILSAIPPIVVGLTMSPAMALKVLILYTVIQQLESNILVPLIMANKVRLHPVTLLFFLLMMAEFLGVFGALIATPLAAVLKVLYMELYYRRLHGTLPEDEAEDPIRIKLLKRFARKSNIGEPPGPAVAAEE